MRWALSKAMRHRPGFVTPILVDNVMGLARKRRAGAATRPKEAVMKFMDTIGYKAVDIGSLSDTWRMEPGTPIYVWRKFLMD
jgi:hypothetical protein